MAGHRYQMNEVGRCAGLVLALDPVLTNGCEVTFVDVGTGAGLALHFDRYTYRFAGPDAATRAAGRAPAVDPVTVETTVRGDAIVPERLPPVGSGSESTSSRSPVTTRCAHGLPPASRRRSRRSRGLTGRSPWRSASRPRWSGPTRAMRSARCSLAWRMTASSASRTATSACSSPRSSAAASSVYR